MNRKNSINMGDRQNRNGCRRHYVEVRQTKPLPPKGERVFCRRPYWRVLS